MFPGRYLPPLLTKQNVGFVSTLSKNLEYTCCSFIYTLLHGPAVAAPGPRGQVLNSVLAEICWGHVERATGAEEAPSWKWDRVSRVEVHKSESKYGVVKEQRNLTLVPLQQGVLNVVSGRKAYFRGCPCTIAMSSNF